VYEALNMAALWRVPLVVVVENNGIAQTTPTSRQLAGTIAGRCAAFGITHLLIDDDDVLRVREQVAGPLSRARLGPEPLVVEFVTRRVGPHSKGDDTREAVELERVRAADWAARYRAAHPAQFERVRAEAAALVERAVAAVLARPESAWHRDGDG
jgi:pyruvate dehydrogenase E1 component alpha subunit